jgi:sugar phosphate permease
MRLVRGIADWRPRTPFYYGWLVLTVAAIGAFAATGVSQIVLGGIQGLIIEDMGWDNTTLALAVTAGTWISGLVTPFVGRLTDRTGPRPLMPVAALVMGVVFFALAGIGAVWHFYAAYIVGRAIANPILIGVVPRTMAVNFFRRRRNLAIGLTAMARPFGGAINIQAISLIARTYDWRVAYRALGVFALVMAIPLFVVMRRRPEDIGLRPDGDENPEPARSAHQRTPASRTELSDEEPEFDWRPGEAVRTSTFWLILIAISVIILTSGSVSFQIVPFLKDSGQSQAVAAIALSLSSLMGAIANPIGGLLSDRFSPRVMWLVLLVVSAAVMSLFLATSTGSQRFIVVVVWGTTTGGLNIMGSMLMAEYFGRSSYGSITGLMGPIQTGALGLGPTFGAVLFKLTDSYMTLFVYGAASYMLAMFFIYMARPPRLPQRAVAGRQPAIG